MGCRGDRLSLPGRTVWPGRIRERRTPGPSIPTNLADGRALQRGRFGDDNIGRRQFSGLAALKLVNANSPRRLVPASSHNQLSQTGQQCQRPESRDCVPGNRQTG